MLMRILLWSLSATIAHRYDARSVIQCLPVQSWVMSLGLYKLFSYLLFRFFLLESNFDWIYGVDSLVLGKSVCVGGRESEKQREA